MSPKKKTHPLCKVSLFVLAFSLVALLSLCGCGESTFNNGDVQVIQAPRGFAPVPYPIDNVPNDSKIELGRYLFYDIGLSADSTVSCASCHYQQFGFADSRPVSLGVKGENGSRNSPAIINVAYNDSWFWDGRASSLEQQVRAALVSRAEMSADTNLVATRIQNRPEYLQLFQSAFGDSSLPTTYRAVQALATFCRSLVSGHSRFDKYIFGDATALSDEEQRGMKIFFDEKSKCSHCHSGINFTDNTFHSIALHAHYYDKGRFDITGKERDIGKFKTPTLRNIAQTAPYTNEGHIASLEQMIQHYNHGGEPFRFKDTTLIKVLNLDSTEVRALVAFLRSLTDEDFLNNPKYRNPYN